VSIYPTVK